MYTGSVILTYEVVPDHTSFSLWRQVGNGTRDFISDQLPATGIYSDTDVSVGTTYHYWIWANDAEGHASCVLGPSTVTLDPNATPPEGVVKINNGALNTNSPQVILNINATADAAEMQVGNSMAQFNAANSWEAYKTTKNWTLAPAKNTGVVYVRFRDASGNVSEPAVAMIHITGSPKIYLPLVKRQ